MVKRQRRTKAEIAAASQFQVLKSKIDAETYRAECSVCGGKIAVSRSTSEFCGGACALKSMKKRAAEKRAAEVEKMIAAEQAAEGSE